MFNKLIILLFLFVVTSYGQISRTKAMGDLTYSISDRDHSFNLYDFGNNPAWIIVDEQESWLEVTPSASNTWGKYRRIYDPKQIYNFQAGFIGVKPLGDAGTFRGMANYNYQIRRQVNRILTKYPYNGSAFFFTDETKGDVTYKGPTCGFMYGYELFDNFYTGASINYCVENGLKEVYTFAETIYRNVTGNVGIAYQISDNFSIGAKVDLFDSQERITAEDVNNFDVLTHFYVGDLYSTRFVGSSKNYKIQDKGISFGPQFYWLPTKELEIGLKSNYYLSTSTILIPSSGFIDVEEGFTSYENFELSIGGKYSINENFLLGMKSEYSSSNFWSKNFVDGIPDTLFPDLIFIDEKLELLVWDTDFEEFNIGIGASHKFSNFPLMVGIEYELSKLNSDSSKYIDNKFISISTLNHLLRLGLEYEINSQIIIRTGLNYGIFEKNIFLGGEDIQNLRFTFGLGLHLFEFLIINSQIEYNHCYQTINNNLKRDNWTGYLSLRFLSF